MWRCPSSELVPLSDIEHITFPFFAFILPLPLPKKKTLWILFTLVCIVSKRCVDKIKLKAVKTLPKKKKSSLQELPWCRVWLWMHDSGLIFFFQVESLLVTSSDCASSVPLWPYRLPMTCAFELSGIITRRASILPWCFWLGWIHNQLSWK